MKTSVFIVIIHIICAIKCATITTAAEGNQTKLIQNFEKEKAEIYNQLNDAVEDTVQTLKKSNDSDAKQGIAYMQELLALIDKFNDTEFELAQVHTVCNGSKECASNLTTVSTSNSSIFLEDGRRADKYIPSGYEHIKHAIVATGMFKNEDDLNRIRDEKVRNLLVLQTKLDRWLKLREAEKQRIKQYRLKQISHRHETVTEDCPNFGDMKKKSKKSKKSKGGSGKSHKYPCCRKCCKKSYMGCL